MKKSLLALAALLLLLGISPVAAENSPGSLAPFVRYDKATDTLETSIATFRSTSGQELDLISAVHVATPSYYGQLNKEFATYDAVLYELILPESVAGQRLPSQLEGGGAVSGIQGMIANTLGLTTQLSGIDYSARNFVHADLTQEGLAQKMAQRQENMMAYMMKVLSSSQSIDESQLGVTDQELAQLDLVAIMNGKPSARDRKLLKRMFGSTISSSGGVLSALGDTALITERNNAALKVADREVKSGKRRIALFYGAAHMPDLQKKLQAKGWKKTKAKWVKAW